MEVKCHLKAKRNKNTNKHFIEPILLFVFSKNVAGFVTFYFALYLKLVYSNIVRTYETLST